MAKGKKKPTSKPQVKKVEPNPKKVEAKIKEVIKEVPKEKETPIVDKPIVKAEAPVPKKEKTSRHEFPKKEVCKHLNTKRTIDRKLRVMYICTNPECNKIVKFGGR